MGLTFAGLATSVFGGVAEKTAKDFGSLRPHLKGARIKVLLKTWISMTLFASMITFVAALAAMLVIGSLMEMHYLIYTVSLVFVPILAASFAFLGFYLYPMEKAKRRAGSINNNMPFAITHMSAIASSGIPPEFMFSLVAGFKEYGEISTEARLIVRSIRTLGMSSVAAMKSIASQTPSKDFKDILIGISSTIESGGDLTSYLKEMANKAMFDYTVKREKYLKTLSTYADIYTALLVAAPLFMIATLATMSIIGGEVMGLAIPDIVVLMTWVALPLLNVSFLAFVHVTYPGV